MMKVLGVIVGTVLGIVALTILLTLPVLWCWNYVVPEVFGLSTITFWQAFCLVVLAHCLIKSSTTSK